MIIHTELNKMYIANEIKNKKIAQLIFRELDNVI